MLKLILYFVANVLVVIGLSKLLPGFVVSSYVAAAVFLIILTLLNWTIIPLLKILAFPVNFLTLGLANGLINLISVWLAATLVDGIDLKGNGISQFFTLIFVAVGLFIGQSIIDKILDEDNDRQQTQNY